MKRALLLIGVLPASLVAQEQLARCAAIEDDVTRLVCYDRLAQQATAPTGDWVNRTSTNPVDDTQTVMLALQAEWGGTLIRNRPRLILRCRSSKTEAYINWDNYIADRTLVTYRIGSEEARRKVWPTSTNNTVTFYPDNDVTFIKSLLAVDRFVARVVPHNEGPVTAVFNLAGLEVAVRPLRSVCGW